MPQEFAPAALIALGQRITLDHPHHHFGPAGVCGDSSHTYGYHRARFTLPPDDYSVVLQRDREGSPDACSALDIMPADPQVVVRFTERLFRAVARGDERLFRVVREFFGSLDGVTSTGYDLAERHQSVPSSPHTGHVHLSFYRDTNQRPALVGRVAEVVRGRAPR